MRILGSGKPEKYQLYEFTNGIDIDSFLAAQEIQVQKAWAKVLAQAHILKPEEQIALDKTLDEALNLIQSNQFDWRIEDEDIHMNLERFLTEKLGETGKRIHLGRSRNDLIATTLRLFIAQRLNEASLQVSAVIEAILSQSESWNAVIIPGMTHLQNGQPIRMSSVFSSHGWALSRDIERIQIARKRMLEVMPLGSAALAGTTVSVDLEELCQLLGFKLPPQNSYDSVGDRDFVLESLDAFASVGVHLSRFSEDCILWSSTGMGLLQLPSEWSTGSSIMPNKRNPDIPELIRAKSSHLISAAQQAHLLMKGLPTSYNSDLHELKKVFLLASNELEKCLKILVPFIQGLQINTKQAKQLLSQGHILATDIANLLTLEGMSFRDAYRELSFLISEANQNGLSIETYLKTANLKNPFLKKVTEQVTFENAVETRNFSGGTSSLQVKTSLNHLRERLAILLD